MAKVQIKSEKISAFGGIFFVLDKFDRILSSVIDSHLGLRSKLIGYQSRSSTARTTTSDGRTCQVGQNGKAVQTQHLFSKTLQHYLGTRHTTPVPLCAYEKPRCRRAAG